ncbi:MAG: M23 family metallopeptidase [Prolixibacteraceae bacterium]|nr:M23 family metallopeptidase [Prolixibacteraceae bacterium]
MRKAKFRFNPETLKYTKIEYDIKTRISKWIYSLTTRVLLGLLFAFIFLQFYEAPKTKFLQRQNQQLISQYELLDKNLGDIQKVLSDLQDRDDNLYRVIFDADPIPSSVRKAGFGGINKYKQLEDMNDPELVIATSRKLDIISKEAYVQSKSYDEVLKLAMSKEKMMSSIPAIMPVSNKDLKRISAGFGWRIHPIYKIKIFHSGMDFSAPIGTPIYATGDGLVEKIEFSSFGYGNNITIDNGFGYETRYAHMSTFNVKRGEKVKRGSVIGYVGNTGTSTGPHIHYEVHKNGKTVDPKYYFFKDLTASEYEKMVAISDNIGQSYD